MSKKERAAEEEDQASQQIVFERENIRIVSNQSVWNSSLFITSGSPLTMGTRVYYLPLPGDFLYVFTILRLS